MATETQADGRQYRQGTEGQTPILHTILLTTANSQSHCETDTGVVTLIGGASVVVIRFITDVVQRDD